MQPPIMQRGRFITIEGGEGVGKSSFSSRLADHLVQCGQKIVKTAEPGGTPAAQAIRQLFLHPPSDDSLLPETELFLVSAARVQHLGKKIIPSLDRGEWVLCDRFVDSMRVYQGEMGRISQDLVESMIQISCRGVDPDLTFLLDCDVSIMLERLRKRQSLNREGIGGAQQATRFDEAGLVYHEKLRQAYLNVARRYSDRIAILDASQNPDQVVEQALHLMRQKGFLKA